MMASSDVSSNTVQTLVIRELNEETPTAGAAILAAVKSGIYYVIKKLERIFVLPINLSTFLWDYLSGVRKEAKGVNYPKGPEQQAPLQEESVPNLTTQLLDKPSAGTSKQASALASPTTSLDNNETSSPDFSLSPTGMRFMFGSQSTESLLLLPPPSPCRLVESPTISPVKDEAVSLDDLITQPFDKPSANTTSPDNTEASTSPSDISCMFGIHMKESLPPSPCSQVESPTTSTAKEEAVSLDSPNTQLLDKPSAGTPKQASALASPTTSPDNTEACSPDFSLSPTGMRYMFGSQSTENLLLLLPPSPCRQVESPTISPVKDDEATTPETAAKTEIERPHEKCNSQAKDSPKVESCQHKKAKNTKNRKENTKCCCFSCEVMPVEVPASPPKHPNLSSSI